jgi:anthranilate synthase component 2
MILIIDNYDSFTYNLYQGIAPFSTDIQVVRNDKITLEEIKALKPSGIILSPGPGRPENAGLCIELIRTTEIPLLGVCLGHQAITMAFGGKVISAPTILHGKSDLISYTGTTIYKGLPLPFEAGRYHSLLVERASLPAELRIEAINDEDLIMGIRHRTRPIYGVQFHPESILTPQGSLLLKNFIQHCYAN